MGYKSYTELTVFSNGGTVGYKIEIFDGCCLPKSFSVNVSNLHRVFENLENSLYELSDYSKGYHEIKQRF